LHKDFDNKKKAVLENKKGLMFLKFQYGFFMGGEVPAWGRVCKQLCAQKSCFKMIGNDIVLFNIQLV
jgi:hypothetical protein